MPEYGGLRRSVEVSAATATATAAAPPVTITIRYNLPLGWTFQWRSIQHHLAGSASCTSLQGINVAVVEPTYATRGITAGKERINGHTIDGAVRLPTAHADGSVGCDRG